jgi:rhodanese-related sulfurtransferase
MKKPLVSFLCGILSMASLVIVSPGWSGELTDEQKRKRIDELYARYKKSFPDVPDLTVEKLIAMRERSDIVLVDRREPKEQEVSMLPGAVTSEEFERNLEEYKDKTIVVYCTIGSRSGHYAKRLIRDGMRAYNLKGSILAWTHAGQKLITERKETRRVHVYGRRWNLAPEGYEAVW